MFRIPDFLLEKWGALNANNVVELENVERLGAIRYGFEYSYILLIYTIALFYGAVVPLVLPAGLLFLVLKFLFDKVRLMNGGRWRMSFIRSIAR